MAVPQRLGRYTLGDAIGEGGMGVVYRARIEGAEGFARVVAVKMVHRALARDPGIREAFLTEAKTAQRLQHGNIVQIVDVGLDDDLPYLVIEYVDGVSLADLLAARKESRALPIGDALHIAESVASALAYAHGLTDGAGRADGVVHRDVTPRNILLSRDGLVKLVDFGLAKALSAPSYTLPGTVKGSLGYIAPEQARGDPVDARADQFSTGIVLREMLTGENPIAVRDVEAYHASLRAGFPPMPAAPPPLDAELAAIVDRATALDPATRFPSMDELRAELEAWRVARKIRTSSDSLRDTVRTLVGGDATLPGVRRPLGDALADRMPAATVKTVRHLPPPSGPRAKRAWRTPALWAGVVVVAALVATIAYLVAAPGTARPAPDAAAPVAIAMDAAPPPPVVTSPDATPTLAPVKRRFGRLQVNVVPYAEVTLDGKPLGRVPIDMRVTAGTHRLRLYNPETGARVTRPIRIEPDATLAITKW